MIRTSSIIHAALSSHRTSLTEPEAKSLCKEYSILTSDYEVAKTEYEAEETARIPVYETAERAVNAAHALVRQAEVSGKIVPEGA